MSAGIGKPCLSYDKSPEGEGGSPYPDPTTDTWHPALKTLIIAGGSAALWVFILNIVI